MFLATSALQSVGVPYNTLTERMRVCLIANCNQLLAMPGTNDAHARQARRLEARVSSVEAPEPIGDRGMIMKLRNVAGAILASVAMALAMAGPAAALTLNVFTDPHPTMCCGTIGFAYIGDGFVG
ncbi:MAG TPA: hypothetical protein VFI50_06955, partial [Casimicrobiaceae bacterium]|nr:hypothetical protein [Casimicrobiaceae bacterium]